MSEQTHNYFVSQLVQDLEDNLHDSKRRAQRLRRQNDQLAAENERLRDGIEAQRDTCARVATMCRSSNDPEAPAVASNLESVARALTNLLDGDTE